MKGGALQFGNSEGRVKTCPGVLEQSLRLQKSGYRLFEIVFKGDAEPLTEGDQIVDDFIHNSKSLIYAPTYSSVVLSATTQFAGHVEYRYGSDNGQAKAPPGKPESDSDRGDSEVEHTEWQQNAPSDVHQLVVSKSWEGGSDPDEEEHDAPEFRDEP